MSPRKSTPRYRVAAGRQVNLDGTLYGPGDTFDANEKHPTVIRSVRVGWLEDTTTSPSSDEDTAGDDAG